MDKPQYPNLDNVSFLILDVQMFYCIDGEGRPISSVIWPDAYKLPDYDERFVLADNHLIVNWRKVTKIDYMNELIYIDDTPVWFNHIRSGLVFKLKHIVSFDKETKTANYYLPPVSDPPPKRGIIKYLFDSFFGA